MTEEFLHYIWKYRLINTDNLISQTGQAIEIISPGFHNFDEGPDFSNARIKIDNTLWAGNIEIHLKSSDWKKHKHHLNQKYDNIILHVVYENDIIIKRKNDEPITTIELKNRIDINLYHRYKKLLSEKTWIPCEKNIDFIENEVFNIWKEKLIIERLFKKSHEIETIYINNLNDWEQTFYEFISANFGFKLNAVPFRLLAKSLPLKILAKHKDSLFQTEALIFGQAGFLDDNFSDEYPKLLKKEYSFLSHKYSLKPINSSTWLTYKIRPYNFPHLRLAQFAAFLCHSYTMFSKITKTSDVKDFYKYFSYSCSKYWETHFTIDKKSNLKVKNMGKSAVDNIIINTFIPFLFAYGDIKKEENIKERALFFLNKITPEANSIIKNWQLLKIKASNASDSQALIELFNSYCAPKKCLSCMIGIYLLRK